MKVLLEKELDFIREDLQQKGLNDQKLTEEILDHICCAVEDKLNLGLSFDKAYQEVLESFGETGIKQIQQEKNKLNSSFYNWKKHFGLEYTTVFVLLLFLSIFARDGKAQGHPDITPFQIKKVSIQDLEKNSLSGVRFEVPAGTPVVATARGRVAFRDVYGLSISHEGDVITHYKNLEKLTVHQGAWVNKGDIIGYVAPAESGKLDSYLHYEITFQGKKLNPLDFFAD